MQQIADSTMAIPKQQATRQDHSGEAAPGAKSSSKSKGIRVSETLLEKAEEHARVAQRSIPKQIEYWSQLGRIFEQHLGGADLHALLTEQKTISHIELVASAIPGPESVFAELEAERRAGSLGTSVTAAPVVYDLSEDGGSLRRHESDGRITIGALVDGEFVESTEP